MAASQRPGRQANAAKAGPATTGADSRAVAKATGTSANQFFIDGLPRGGLQATRKAQE